MTTLFQYLAAAALLLASGAASAVPLEAIPGDDTVYPNAEVTWFSGTTSGGAGLEHDDVTYPEKVVLGGGPAPAFTPLAHDDSIYPEDARLMVQVGSPSVELAPDALAAGTAAPAGSGAGSGSR